MQNRIKEFRKRKNLTQREFVESFNKYLKNKKVKGITTATFSRWENSINSPTKKMWGLLAQYLNTTPIVLQGALSLDEIVEIIQKNYIDEFNDKEHKGFLYSSTHDFLAGIGKIDKNKLWLTPKEQNDYNFWKNNFADIFRFGQPIIWLITNKPVNLDLYSAEALIRSGLDLLIEFYKKAYKDFAPNIKNLNDYLGSQRIPESAKNNSYLNYDNSPEAIENGGYGSFVGERQYFEYMYPDPKIRIKEIKKATKGIQEIYEKVKRSMKDQK